MMTKLERSKKHAKTAMYCEMYRAIYAALPTMLKEQLTARQIAQVIDFIYETKLGLHSQVFASARSDVK